MRHKMRLDLSDWSAPSSPPDPGARRITDADGAALAMLMLNAYRGSVDDGGEGPDEAASEVRKLYDGDFGALDFQTSEVIEREGEVVAATIVTEYEGVPLLAFSMTAPAWKRRGLARAGLVRTINRVRAAGRREVFLAVTATNTPALRLYESLGFVVVPR
jgi:GNAT superfamily N-acetyltransferase